MIILRRSHIGPSLGLRLTSLFLAAASAVLPLQPLLSHEPHEGCEFLDAWDPLGAGAGLSLFGCGVEAIADTGSFTSAHGSVEIFPGERDDLGLGAPIGIAATANDPSLSIEGRNYRVRCSFIGHAGITDAAFFVGVRYDFDEDLGAIDAATFGAVGINFTFDSLGHDDHSDHIHDDVRGPCLVQLGNGGRSEAQYPGFLMATETLWTLTLDVEGDRESGPMTILVKIFAEGDPEPLQPFGVIHVADGQGPDPGAELHHAFLAAALGGGSLEFHDVSICDIPGEERRVQGLACEANDAGGAHIQWTHPSGADLEAPILILVDGEEVASLPGDATEHELATLPQGEVLISVVNFSGAPATCTLGEAEVSYHFLRGDCNAEGRIDISDAVYSLAFLFSGGAAPGCLEACNSNGDAQVDLSDSVHSLAYLFLGGEPPHAPFPGCGHGHAATSCEVEHCPHG